MFVDTVSSHCGTCWNKRHSFCGTRPCATSCCAYELSNESLYQGIDVLLFHLGESRWLLVYSWTSVYTHRTYSAPCWLGSCPVGSRHHQVSQPGLIGADLSDNRTIAAVKSLVLDCSAMARLLNWVPKLYKVQGPSHDEAVEQRREERILGPETWKRKTHRCELITQVVYVQRIIRSHADHRR